jgi:two-component system cell cycle sensor histidine kinase/response regulator CckA
VHRIDFVLQATATGTNVLLEDLHRLIVESAYEGVWVIDAAGRTVFVNRRLTELFRTTADAMRGRTPIEFVREDAREKAAQSLARRRTGVSESIELPYVRGDGSTVWLLVSANPMTATDGTYAGALAMVADITAQVESAEKLRASEERFRALVDNGSDGSALLAKDGTILYGSPAAERILGRSIQGLNAKDFSHPEDRAATEKVWVELLASPGVPIRQTLRLRRVDETWRRVEVVRTNRLDEPGLNAIVSNFRDVTEHDELEAQFRQAQKMEAIGRLAGGVAHDFNNLIAVILTYATMGLEDLPEGSPLRSDLGEIKRASERAAALTRQLLAFSRRQLLQPRVVDLNAAVAEAEKMLRRMVPECVATRFHYDPEPRRVRVDPAAFDQCLMNLVVNARDAMPESGELEISVSARTLDADTAREHGVSPGPYATVSIRDTGVGMDDAVRARLFEPFFTTKERGKGTGLGLSTVFGIVKQSGGGIEVRSAPGAGATFLLFFPQSAEDVEELTPADPSALPAVSGTVLLVEDEAAVREAARRILMRSGFQVLDCASAGEAMVISEKHPDIDLLVTDVVMPWMSGPELAVRLHAMRPGLKVLFISGYPDPVADPEGVLRESKVLAKPFTPEELVRRVREGLSGGA